MSPGPANVRDLGGLPITGGAVTRHGVLVRGDALYDGDAAPPGVDWPPATVIDLRSASERNRSPYVWTGTTTVVARQLFDAAALDAMPQQTSLLDVYADLMAHAGPGIASLLDDLAAEGATFIHCAAGKDRTGVSIATILLLVGVEREAVIADYRATEANMSAVLDRMRERGVKVDDLDPAWAAAPAEAISQVIDAVESHPGGVRGWFVANGADEAAIDRFVARIAGPG